MTDAQSPLPEAEIFRYLLDGRNNDGLLQSGFFDDSAVVPIGDGWSLAISTDFIRGTQFNVAAAGYVTLYDLAYYLIAANASDVAAMGVKPSGFLDVFRYPKSATAHDQKQFFDSLRDAAVHYGVTVVGGDSGSYDEYVLAGTCFGFSKSQSLLYRGNLRPGQQLCVTGNFGRCRAAQVALLETGPDAFTKGEIETLINGWKRPNPPLQLGPWLVENGLATAGQDTSDGVSATVSSLCEMSGVGIDVSLSETDILPEIVKVAKLSGRDPIELAISTSPDFCLMFAVEADALETVKNNPFGYEIVTLGEITDSSTVRFLNSTTDTEVQKEIYDQKNNVKDFDVKKQ